MIKWSEVNLLLTGENIFYSIINDGYILLLSPEIKVYINCKIFFSTSIKDYSIPGQVRLDVLLHKFKGDYKTIILFRNYIIPEKCKCNFVKNYQFML